MLPESLIDSKRPALNTGSNYSILRPFQYPVFKVLPTPFRGAVSQQVRRGTRRNNTPLKPHSSSKILWVFREDISPVHSFPPRIVARKNYPQDSCETTANSKKNLRYLLLRFYESLLSPLEQARPSALFPAGTYCARISA